jgi:NitT/TauT family transport system substrate-binding protein
MYRQSVHTDQSRSRADDHMHAKPHHGVTLQLKWLHQAQFAGYYVAEENGYFAEEGLKVDIKSGGPDVDPEKLIAHGTEDFAQAGGMESLLAARDVGMPVVAIAAVFQKIDVVFIAKRETGITKLTDLSERIVSTWYTGVHLILRALLRESGLDPSKIVEVPQAGSMAPFLQDEVAVAAATLFNQLPMLRAQGVTDLTVFDPADYGVVFPRDTIITSERVVKDRPEIVERFLRASLRGWRFAATNQADAVDAVMRRDPNLQRDHQSVMMREVAKLLSWGQGTAMGIGYIDAQAVASAHKFLFRNGQISSAQSLSDSCTMRFWEAVPLAYKRLRAGYPTR